MAVPHSGIPSPDLGPQDATVAALVAASLTVSGNSTLAALSAPLAGELGGTTDAATVDALHGGSTHASVAADAAAALSSHGGNPDAHGIPSGIRTNGTDDVATVAASGAAYTITTPTANIQDITLTANCTFTMPAVSNGKSFAVRLRQGGVGSFTAAFTGVEWPDDIPPTLATAVGAVDFISFHSDSTVWYGFPAGEPPAALTSGEEIDYVESTAGTLVPTAGTEATAEVIVTSNSVVYDGSTAIIIEAFAPLWSPPASDATAVVLVLWDNTAGVSLGKMAYHTSQAASRAYEPMIGKRRLTPAAGARVYSARAYGNGAEIFRGAGGAGNYMPAFIRITAA